MKGRGHRVHWPEGFGANGSTPIGYCDGTQQLWKGQACEGEMEFSTTEKHLKGILGGAEQYSRVTNKTLFRPIKTSVAIGKPVITTSWLLKEISDRRTVDGELSRKRWNVSPFSKKWEASIIEAGLYDRAVTLGDRYFPSSHKGCEKKKGHTLEAARNKQIGMKSTLSLEE